MLTIVLFVLGFILLIKGADWLVVGASALATKLGISALAVGLTVVAFGTSTPELVVNLFASSTGNTDLAIGNAIGSTITNIWLILGICAVITPLAVASTTVWKEIPFALLAIVVLLIMISDTALTGASESLLSRSEGLVLFAFFGVFLYYILSIARMDENKDKTDSPQANLSTVTACMFVGAGLLSLAVSAKWIVDGAVLMATQLGVSQALIGLTVVAVGTALPELATSVVAAMRKKLDIAVGNVIGSNVFSFFFVLPLTAVISPLPFSSDLASDVWVAIFATVGLFACLFIGRRHMVERWQGALFVLLYVAYTVYLIFRG